MNKIVCNKQIACITLNLLLAANILVWTGVYAGSYKIKEIDRQTDDYEKDIALLNDVSRRTSDSKLLTMDAFLDDVTEIFDNNLIPEGVAAMVSFDGDGMGNINMTYGAEAANRLIYAFADVVRKYFPESSKNIVSNVGERSDEFYMLLMGRPSRKALEQEIIDFQNDIRKIVVLSDAGDKVKGTISIGISFYHDGESFEELFDSADEAAYEAKAAGKNCYRIAKD